MSDIIPISEATEVFHYHCPHLMKESARSVFERLQLNSPFWIRTLVGLRSSVLKPLGFQAITSESFEVLEENEDHLALAFKDKFFSSCLHLRMERDLQRLTFTNNLAFFNKAGEWYFQMSKPIHKIIFKQLLEHL